MIKNKLDFKLINTAIIVFIIYLIYQTGDLWLGIYSKLWDLLFPFIVSFAIAYALHPCLEYLEDHKVPKVLAIGIIVGVVLILLSVIVFAVFPMIFGELPNVFNGIISFIKELSLKSNIDFTSIQNTLSTSFNDIVLSLSKYVSNGAISIISGSINYLSMALIIFSATLYFLSDMSNIKNIVKKYLSKKSKKIHRYIILLDEDMKNYLSGFTITSLISFAEYTLAYTLIGHPYSLVLGFLAMISNLIPYFGGIITNVIAAITAFVISPKLFVITIITFIILSSVDGYVINPLVYGKTNKLHPIIVIMSVFAGGILFGILGILISLPLAIIIITTIRYFKEDINEKIVDIKTVRKRK